MLSRGLAVWAVVMLLALCAVPSASASSTANWGPGVQVGVPGDVAPSPNAEVSINSISCPSAGNCVAVGDYRDSSNQSQSLLLTETNGTWAAGVKPFLPTGGVSSDLASVSCPSTGNCTAVGDYTDTLSHGFGLIVTETSGTWGPGTVAPLPNNAATPSPSALLRSVSCPSVGNCSAVGTYFHDGGTHGVLLSESAAMWTAVEASLPTGAAMNPQTELESVSCPSAGNCGAVGEYTDAAGTEGVLLTESAGSWAPSVKAGLTNPAANPSVSLPSVSCPAAGDCAAVGGYQDNAGGFQALVFTEQAGTWGPAAKVTSPNGAAANPQAGLDGVSCASPGNCSAVGSYFDSGGSYQGLLVSESSGTWGPAQQAMLPPDAATSQTAHFNIPAVSCASPGDCGAVGEYKTGAGMLQGMFLTEFSGTWSQGAGAIFPTQSTNQSSAMQHVSCATPASCGASGIYFDSSGNRNGALFDTAPAAPTLSVTAPAVGNTGAAIAASSASAVLASGMSPVGQISFKVFGPQSSPPASCGSGGTTLGSATVAGNGTYHPASGFQPPGAGDYWWYASYSGDASDNPVASSCGASMVETVVPGPVLSAFRQSHRRWTLGDKLAKISRARHKPPVGTTFSFSLSEAATVTLAFGKHLPGRIERHHGKKVCAAPTKHNAHGRACTRIVTLGKLKLKAHAGKDKLVFQGRLSAHKKLAPGTYTVTITATNASGSSAPKKLTFTIVQ